MLTDWSQFKPKEETPGGQLGTDWSQFKPKEEILRSQSDTESHWYSPIASIAKSVLPENIYKSAEAGVATSATGLAERVRQGKTGMPQVYQPQTFIEKATSGIAGMASELPQMWAGAAAAAPAGAAIGSLGGLIGSAIGGIAGGGAGAFAAPTAMREAMRQKLETGSYTSDVGKLLKETATEGAIGGLTSLVGAGVGLKALAPEIRGAYKAALKSGEEVMLGGKAVKLADVILSQAKAAGQVSAPISKLVVPAAEIGTFTTAGTLAHEGRIPTPEEYALSAVPIAGLHLVQKGRGFLGDKIRDKVDLITGKPVPKEKETPVGAEMLTPESKGEPAGLRPIMKTKETGESIIGEPGQTHQDMIDAGLASKGDREGFITPEGVPLNRSEAMKWAIENHKGIETYLNPNEAGNLHTENYNQALEKLKAEPVKGLPENVVSKQELTGEELMRKYQQDTTEKFWNDEFAKRDIKEAEQEAFKQSPLGAELLQKQLREQQLSAIPKNVIDALRQEEENRSIREGVLLRAKQEAGFELTREDLLRQQEEAAIMPTDIVSPVEEIPSTGISAVPKNLIVPEVNIKAAPEVKSEPLAIDKLVDVGKEGAAPIEVGGRPIIESNMPEQQKVDLLKRNKKKLVDELSVSSDTEKQVVITPSQAEHMKMGIGLEGSGTIKDSEGNVIGRHGSGRFDWLQGVRTRHSYTYNKMEEIIDKHLAGKKLGKGEARLIEDLRDSSLDEFDPHNYQSWRKAQIQGGDIKEPLQGKQIIDLTKLKPGDKFIINGEEFTHKGLDEDWDIIVEDGKKYKIDPNRPDDNILEVDKFTPKEESWFTPPQQENIKKTPAPVDMFGAKGVDISGGKLPEGVPVGEAQFERAVRENNEAKLLAEQNKKQGNLPIDKQVAREQGAIQAITRDELNKRVGAAIIEYDDSNPMFVSFKVTPGQVQKVKKNITDATYVGDGFFKIEKEQAGSKVSEGGGAYGENIGNKVDKGVYGELSANRGEPEDKYSGDTKDIEALRRAYGEGTGKLIDKAFFKEANVSMQSNEGKDKNVTLSSGLAGAYEEIAKIIKSGEIQKAYGHIVDVAKNFYEHGKTTFKQFNDNMKEFLGDAYGHVKDLVTRAYTEVKNAAIRTIKQEGERGAIGPRGREEKPVSTETDRREDTFAYVKKAESIYRDVKKEADIFTDKSIFMKRDIKPAIKAASNGLSGAWDGLKKVVYPMGTTEGARTAGEILIEEMGHGFQSYEKTKGVLNEISKKYSKSTDLAAKFMDYIQTSTGVLSDKLFNKMSKADQNEFIYNIQKDLSQKTPELRDTAKVLSSMFEDLWKEADKTIPGLIKHRKDFFVGMWEDPESAQRFFEGRAKSAEGSKSYTKPKLFSDIYEGIEAGQTPKGSPLDMAFSYMHNIRKLLSTHKALQAIEKEGGAVLVPSGEKTPYGFTLIPEPYGVITKRMGEGEMGEPIETSYRYAVKEDVAQVFNNYLSSNLYNSPYAGDAYKAYMGAGNTLNQFQLGVGAAFHAGFESMETIVNHQALAWKAFARRDYKQAAKLYLESPLMIARSPMRGDKVIKALHGDSAALAEMPNIIEWVTMAGGRVAVDNRLRTHATDSMLKQWSEGNKMGAVLRSPIAIVEQLARPIMEYLVPRQKMGVFYEKAKDWVDRHPNATHEEMRKAMQSAWNMVDMTMGQVVYERMFMHNIAKNVVQGLLRAPGWTGGTALVLGGAAKDMVKIFKDMSMGKRVEMTDKLAYTTSLLVTTAIVNGVMTTLMTGEQPKKEDLMAFRTGRMDNRGLPERFLLPTYAKDLYAYMNSPKATLLNKTHPLISLMSDIAKNKDYYGTEIRSKDSNIPTQAGEVGAYVAKAFVPFWMRGASEAQERGKSIAGAIAPLVGIMPASTEYTKTDATRLLAEYSKEHQPAMSRTKEEFERMRLRQSLKRDMRAGGSIKLVGDAIRDGRLTPVEGRNIIKNAHLTPLQEGIKSSALRPDEALKVWDKATNDEKVEIRKYMLKKMHSIKNMLPEQRTDMLAKYREVRDWKPE